MEQAETERRETIAARIPPAQKAIIDRACELDGGRSISSLIVVSTLDAAKRIIREKDPDFLASTST